MKDVPQHIEKIFITVRDLVKNRIINAEFAERIDIEKQNITSLKDSKNVLQKKHTALTHPRVYLAQLWLTLTFLILAESKAYYDDENTEGFIKPFFQALLLTLLISAYEKSIGQLPFQKTVDKLILNSNEYDKKQKTVAFIQAQSEAVKNGPFSNWRLIFPNEKLESMFDAHKITVMMHQSILRALSGLKHNIFDCVSANGLLLLKLIEEKIPYEIVWYYKEGNSFDGHNFLMVKADNNDIILDAWYGILSTIEQSKQDKDFYLRYPLLGLADKRIMATIKPNQHGDYKNYIEMLNEALAISSQSKKFIF